VEALHMISIFRIVIQEKNWEDVKWLPVVCCCGLSRRP